MTNFQLLFGGGLQPTTLPVPTKVPGFVPNFRTAFVVDSFTSIRQPLNKYYFATFGTAQWIANLYGDKDKVVYERPYGGAGGQFYCTEVEYHIKLAAPGPDGNPVFVNAGILASYYDRNPEDQFPGLADKLVRGVLGLPPVKQI